MGTDGKYGKVTTEHGNIPPDEPVIVFRARDALALDVIDYYMGKCIDAGSPEFHVMLVAGTRRRFARWQRDNSARVRVPSSEEHRERLERDEERGQP